MDMQELEALLADPQARAALGLSTIDDEQALLEQQMAQAEALRRGRGGEFSTPIGAALGGLGDLAGSIGGGLQQRDLQAKMAELIRKRGKLRNAFADSVLDQQKQLRTEAMSGLTAPGAGVIAPRMGGGM